MSDKDEFLAQEFVYTKNLMLWEKVFAIFRGFPAPKYPKIQDVLNTLVEQLQKTSPELDINYFDDIIKEERIRKFISEILGISILEEKNPTIFDYRYFNIHRIAKVFTVLYLEVTKQKLEGFKPLPIKLLFPAIELISIDDELDTDDILVKRYANLFLSAIKGYRARQFHVQVMKDLSPNEWKMLDYIFNRELDRSIFDKDVRMATIALLQEQGFSYKEIVDFAFTPWSKLLVVELPALIAINPEIHCPIQLSPAGIEFMKLTSFGGI